MGKPSSWWAGGTRAVGELFYSLLPTPTPGLNTHIPGLPYVHFYMEFLGYWVLHPKKRMVGYICQRGPAPLLPSTPRSQHQQLNSQKPDLLQWVREQSTHIPKRKKKKKLIPIPKGIGALNFGQCRLNPGHRTRARQKEGQISPSGFSLASLDHPGMRVPFSTSLSFPHFEPRC